MRTGDKAFRRCGNFADAKRGVLRSSAVVCGLQVEGPGKGGEKFEVFKGEELRLQARHLALSRSVSSTNFNTER